MRTISYHYRLCLIITILLMLALACGFFTTGNPDYAAKTSFEKWAQQVGIPYKNVSYETTENDGTFATVRVQATLKESRMEDWLEKKADIECQHVGSEWQCSSNFVFALTEAERDRQAQRASGTATAVAIKLRATATEQSRQAEATQQALIATQSVVLQNMNATATAIALGATATALAPRPTSPPNPMQIYTEHSWLTHHTELVGWEAMNFDDSNWIPSLVVTDEGWDKALQGMDRGAKWVWNPYAKYNEPVFFRKKFNLSASPISAILRISGDDAYEVFINGIYIGEDVGKNASWIQAESYTVTSYLAFGTNVIAVRVIDFRDVGGLIASLTVWY